MGANQPGSTHEILPEVEISEASINTPENLSEVEIPEVSKINKPNPPKYCWRIRINCNLIPTHECCGVGSNQVGRPPIALKK